MARVEKAMADLEAVEQIDTWMADPKFVELYDAAAAAGFKGSPEEMFEAVKKFLRGGK